MKIDATTFAKLPDHLKALFIKAPNPGSDEVLAGFPVTSSHGDNGGPRSAARGNTFGTTGGQDRITRKDTGSAARFFYCAKASKRDRDEGLEGFEDRPRPTMGNVIGGQPDQLRANNRNIHPTVKPTDLMRYLCRLVTPPRGVVLDPFMGSGSTGKAAKLEGFQFIGIEREAEYLEIAKARIEGAGAG